MLQGNTLHRDAPVFIDNLALGGIYGIEHHLETQIMGEELNLPIQFRPQCLWRVDVQFGGAPQQSEGGDHADETEAVVTMQMSDKHMPQLGEPQVALAKLHLSSLRTIQHQQLLTHLNHLRRGVMTKRRKCTATS